jgi:hypothetical protein
MGPGARPKCMNSGGSNRPSQMPSAPLRRAGLIMRLTAIGVVLAGIAGLCAYAGGCLTPQTLSTSMINTFEQVNAPHPGFRRNHAKGVCVTGHFDSNGNGVAFSKLLFSFPVVCRSLDGLRWWEDSHMSLMLRRQCAAWRFCSNCRTAKSGAPA